MAEEVNNFLSQSIFIIYFLTFLCFQLPALLESHVAADINFRAATVSDYTDAINLLACHQGLPHTVKHGRSRSYHIKTLNILHTQ